MKAQPTVRRHHAKQPGQSVQAPDVKISSLDDTFRVATIVTHILMEVNGSVSKEAKIVSITKIVLNLMKQTGHWISEASESCSF
jgi:hypothetical protein